MPSENRISMTADEIRARLSDLSPEIPWAHHFDFGNGIETISADNQKFYGKANSLKKLGKIIARMVPFHTRRQKLSGLRVLDIASAEGEHSIRFAQRGAEVVGIEGRQLYIDRANFAADVLGVGDRTTFIKGDVRELDSLNLGKFDLVVASGILHHLNAEVFETFLKSLQEHTTDTCIIYTHISTELSIKNHRLQGPVETSGGYSGYLFREHQEGASAEQKLKQVRASLDNTQSFWATERSLTTALVDSGFDAVYRSLHPHVFGNYDNASYRPIVVCRNASPKGDPK